MHPSDQDKRELHTILGAIRDDCLQPAQEARLQELLSQYPQLQEEYVEYLYLCVHLHLNRPMAEKTLIEVIEPAKTTRLDLSDIKAKADRQLNAFLAEERARNPQIEKPTHSPRITIDVRSMARRLMVWGRMSAVAAIWIFGLLLVALIVAGGYQTWLSKQVVAQIVQTESSQWETVLPESGGLRRGEYTLSCGLARIRFRGGAEVLVQAPCEFKLVSKGTMYLESGQITGNIPPQAKGFTVDTPTGRLVDYGTAFGMSINRHQYTEVHVFTGEVRLNSHRQRKSNRRLLEGQAVSMEADGKMAKVAIRPQSFRQEITDEKFFGIPGVRIDLADIVGGGYGYGTGNMESGISLITGLPTSQLSYGNRKGVPGFRSVPSLSFVDGVFLPDGSNGAVQVSTEGHVFEDCPPTSKQYWTEVSNSRYISDADIDADGNRLIAQIESLYYGSRERPLIYMHSNTGITFDLAQIREHTEGSLIHTFTAMSALSETHKNHERKGYADMWVLVDGDVRFEKKGLTAQHEPVPIRVPLEPKDRFLTLAVTDHDRDMNFDVALFGEPALLLSPIK